MGGTVEELNRRRTLKSGSPSDLFLCDKKEVLCDGTTRSAKTFSVLIKVNMTAKLYPGCRQLVVRQTRKSLNESVLADWRNEILWLGHEAIRPTSSKEHQDLYEYKNGSVVFFSGLENMNEDSNPLLSTKWDRIYVVQAEETSKSDCQKLITRLSSFRTPYHQIVYDCNPANPGHWLNTRFSPESLGKRRARFPFRIWDNPLFYKGIYPNGEWTREGAEYRDTLELLEGIEYDRYALGLWVAAEGQILQNWDPRIHSIDGQLEKTDYGGWLIHAPSVSEQPIRVAYFTAGVDFGWKPDPGCMQLWAYDSPRWHPLVRRFRVAEVMKLEWQMDEWADLAEKWWRTYDVRYFSCDPSDPEHINDLNIRLSKAGYRSGPKIAIKCPPIGGGHQRNKHHAAAIDLMREGLKSPKGHTRTYFFKDAFPEGIDEGMRRAGRATCAEKEIEFWCYEVDSGGNPTTKPSREFSSHGHAIYAWMYDETLNFVRGFGKPLSVPEERHLPGSDDWLLAQDLKDRDAARRSANKRREPWR